MLLGQLYNSSPLYKSVRRLAAAIELPGFGEKSVQAYFSFTKHVIDIGCYKLLYSVHNLSWGYIARHIPDFFALVKKYPSGTFQLRSPTDN